jgi:lipid A disaccharide synthetase
MAMPELLQRNATAENLADALIAVTMDSPARQRQCDAFARLEQLRPKTATQLSTSLALLVDGSDSPPQGLQLRLRLAARPVYPHC